MDEKKRHRLAMRARGLVWVHDQDGAMDQLMLCGRVGAAPILEVLGRVYLCQDRARDPELSAGRAWEGVFRGCFDDTDDIWYRTRADAMLAVERGVVRNTEPEPGPARRGSGGRVIG